MLYEVLRWQIKLLDVIIYPATILVVPWRFLRRQCCKMYQYQTVVAPHANKNAIQAAEQIVCAPSDHLTTNMEQPCANLHLLDLQCSFHNPMLLMIASTVKMMMLYGYTYCQCKHVEGCIELRHCPTSLISACWIRFCFIHC